MIFRIKRHWWCSLLATAAMLALAWNFGGVEQWTGRFETVAIALGVGVIAGGVCGAANLAVHTVLRSIGGARYDRAFETHALDVIGRMTPLDAAAGGLMAAAGEEPLFRGVICSVISERLASPVLGVVIAAMLFGLAHWLRREFFWFFVWGIGEGLAFGALFVASGSILVPAVAHGLFDTIGFLYFERLRDQVAARGAST